MPDKLELEIVTPERRVLSEMVDEVVLPSANGYMGVLTGHAPLMALLDIGELSVRVGNQRRYLSVSGGFAEVLRHRVSILAETSELSDEIDLDRAQRARHEAEKQLKLDLSEHQFRRAEVRLKKAISRIQVHGRAGH